MMPSAHQVSLNCFPRTAKTADSLLTTGHAGLLVLMAGRPEGVLIQRHTVLTLSAQALPLSRVSEGREYAVLKNAMWYILSKLS